MIAAETYFHLGYDQMGNAPDLLSESDRLRIERGDWWHGSADHVCEVCGYSLRVHPKVQGALWLTRTCVGLIKL